jgi:putative SOS response-associated peptidase YedK
MGQCGGNIVLSCSMIITAPNEFTRPVHNRMPAFLDKKHFESWLSGAAGRWSGRPDGSVWLSIRRRECRHAGEPRIGG